MSWPPEANRQVTNLPSAERRALTQSPQKGEVTDEIKPISPEPSECTHLTATSLSFSESIGIKSNSF